MPSTITNNLVLLALLPSPPPRGHTNFVFSVCWSPSMNLLVTGGFDEKVKLWDPRCGSCVSSIEAHSEAVTSVSMNRDGTTIASSSFDGLVRLWDTRR